MPYNLTVAVTKGRVMEAVSDLWRSTPWSWPEDGGRKLWFPPAVDRPGLIIARGQDIPSLVQRGIAAFGIVGRDILEEHPIDEVLEVLDLGIARCRMSLAALNADWPDGPARVATKYPNIARRFFRAQDHPVEVVTLSGSLELAPHIGLAPYIVDVVQTGQTLKEHRLQEIATIFHSSARLIANPAAWRLGREADSIYQTFKAAVDAGSETRLLAVRESQRMDQS